MLLKPFQIQLLALYAKGKNEYVDPAEFVNDFNPPPDIITIRRWGTQLYYKKLLDCETILSIVPVSNKGKVYCLPCRGYKINAAGLKVLEDNK